MSSEHISPRADIAQLPAVVIPGKTIVCQPELLKLSRSQLKEYAETLGGELHFIKMDVTYIVNSTFCRYQDCYRPAEKNSDNTRKMWCSDHRDGISKKSF